MQRKWPSVWGLGGVVCAFARLLARGVYARVGSGSLKGNCPSEYPLMASKGTTLVNMFWFWQPQRELPL